MKKPLEGMVYPVRSTAEIGVGTRARRAYAVLASQGSRLGSRSSCQTPRLIQVTVLSTTVACNAVGNDGTLPADTPATSASCTYRACARW